MKSIAIVLALAAISAVIAAPMAPDAVVPETSLLQTAAEMEAEANAEAWNNAKTAVATLLASGKDGSACGDLADSILSEVQSVVKQKEELLATMADGSECPSEGQGIVDAAQGHLTEAQATKASADAAAATAASAPVDFGVYPLSNLAGLANNQCSMFENDAAYAAAKNAADAAASAAATAAADVTAAETAVEDAKTTQKAAIKKCECDTYTAFEAAYKSANTRSDADLEAWKKGQHMKCVLAGSDPSTCDVGSPPEVTKRALAQGVSEACVSQVCPEGANSVSFPIQTAMGPAQQTSTGSGIPNVQGDNDNCPNCQVDVSGSCQEGYTFTPKLNGPENVQKLGAWYRGAFAPMKINQDDLPVTLSWTASVQGDGLYDPNPNKPFVGYNDAYMFVGLDYVNNNEQKAWYDCQFDFVGRCQFNEIGGYNHDPSDPSLKIFTEYQQGCKTDNSILENSCSCGDGGNFEIKVAKDGTVTYHKDGTLCVTSRAKATNFPLYVETSQFGVRAVASKIMVTRG